MARKHNPLACSFCGKHQDQVERLIAGPGVYICNGCIHLCNEILAAEPPAASTQRGTGQAAHSRRRSSTRHVTTPWWRRLLGRWWIVPQLSTEL